jgi:tRNA 2-thiouridine synthesizing protein A
MTQFDQELDLTGLNCPLPILRTKKALALVEPGTVIKVIGTDPGSPREFHMFAKQGSAELISVTEDEDSYIYFLRKL